MATFVAELPPSTLPNCQTRKITVSVGGSVLKEDKLSAGATHYTFESVSPPSPIVTGRDAGPDGVFGAEYSCPLVTTA